ncbi:alpha/beta fold hydrolase [Phytoactinopolyspora limicola]|uniref:alpha/beta fold hydrolase n=1 Tax=Phytoactinopolyspora limicola TaxID=2715536 RepID=UPI00140D0980|nr:alpha/beta hydrolase [Phytoactinopolyspora limicola]
MNATTTVTSADGTQIAYYRSGTGPPLIVVDGALCSYGFGPAAELVDVLSPHFTVYAYDRRGRGASGDKQPFHVDREIEDLDALIAVAGGTAFVYGISSGAALVLHAAARGSAVIKMVLFEPPFTAEFGDPAEVNNEHAILDEMLAAGQHGAAVERFLSYMMPPEVITGMRESPVWSTLESAAPTIAYDNASMGDGTIPRGTARMVDTPTLVVAGDESPAELRHVAKALADALPAGRYREVGGLSHTSAPQPLAPVLREFLIA